MLQTGNKQTFPNRLLVDMVHIMNHAVSTMETATQQKEKRLRNGLEALRTRSTVDCVK